MKGLVIFLMSAMFMVGCATTKGAPESVADVNVGDKLTMTDEKHTDCTLKVANIATLQPTPFGIVKMKSPSVCGFFQCSKGSIPEAAKPLPACFNLEAFMTAKEPAETAGPADRN